MKTKTIVHKSAAPIYAAAVMWLLYGLLFPLYQVGHFLLAAVASAVVAIVARLFCRDVTEEVEIQIKYAGYLARQQKQVEDFRKMERHKLPADLDYSGIQGLRLEAREKLAAIRPLDLGQASRISGVSPADVAALMIWLERR